MVQTLESLVKQAARDGWAVARTTVEQVRRSATSLGWVEVPTRRGDPGVATLRPTAPDRAHPKSLSVTYGKGAQPLHTDGAHLAEPPDVVVLKCVGTSTVATLLWRAPGSVFLNLPSYVSHGVFLIGSGPDTFFDVAADMRRLRYDPGCMTPGDARARQAVQYFTKAAESAVEHRWTDPETILVIDNRIAMHARADATGEPDREIQRVAFRVKGTAT